MNLQLPAYRLRLIVVPSTLRAARAFVQEHHRHHRAPQGGLFAAGLSRGGGRIGVVIVGMPVARMLADGLTAEVTRLCVLDGAPNGCSMLYAAAWRATRALGYRRLITYTLPAEGGASLRASGWECMGQGRGGEWSRKGRERADDHPTEPKWRWEKRA